MNGYQCYTKRTRDLEHAEDGRRGPGSEEEGAQASELSFVQGHRLENRAFEDDQDAQKFEIAE